MTELHSPLPSAPPGAVVTTPPTPRRRRRHPARGARVGALGASLATTAGLAAAFAAAQPAPVALVTAAASPQTATATPVASTPSSATAASSAPGESAATSTPERNEASDGSSGYAAGTFTGATFTNRWGPVQVAVTISDGRITDVVALALPTGGKNDTINARAVPVLRSEVLAAQSADIAVVSGATLTWQSYRQSLQSALDQAITAAGTI